ncbi:glycine-rich protein DC7.1-like [Alnus glutinosa]|uniref:glycine-rich protein DC7.1-like n=1 Tax=Alnus glutinosa TaxID=3517 RepID=UPI002D78CC56|nr:glycine-rich protein DC7.1-like [Alnus glutinosa]
MTDLIITYSLIISLIDSSVLLRKMGSKAFLLLGLLLAIVLLVSSEVSPRDLAKTSSDQRKVEATKEANVVDDAKYGEFGGKRGGGYGGYQGGRSRDPRILTGLSGGRHRCPGNRSVGSEWNKGPGGCLPTDHDAETEAKPQN